LRPSARHIPYHILTTSPAHTSSLPASVRPHQNINKSLSSLEQVILALQNRQSDSKSGASSASAAQQHIPYRNSKLTLLLSDALGAKGTCAKTLLLLHVSPCASSAPETTRTLRFGERCAQVCLGAVRRDHKRANKAAEAEGAKAAQLASELASAKRAQREAEARARAAEARTAELQVEMRALKAGHAGSAGAIEEVAEEEEETGVRRQGSEETGAAAAAEEEVPPPVEAWADDAPAPAAAARPTVPPLRTSKSFAPPRRPARPPTGSQTARLPTARALAAPPPTARHIPLQSSSSMAAFGKADRANKAAAAAVSKAAEAEDAENRGVQGGRGGGAMTLRSGRSVRPAPAARPLAATDRTIEDAAMRRPATAPQRAGGAYGAGAAYIRKQPAVPVGWRR